MSTEHTIISAILFVAALVAAAIGFKVIAVLLGCFTIYSVYLAGGFR